MKVLYLQYALRFFSPCACACFDHERKDCDFDGGLIGIKEMCASGWLVRTQKQNRRRWWKAAGGLALGEIPA